MVLVKFPGTNGQKKTAAHGKRKPYAVGFFICSSLYDSTEGTGLAKGQNKGLSGLFDENPGKSTLQ
ncbi:hypothetical protein [uncultured Allofournierella sp.]|uniref:hypothetical protein n=1 Tax=uncultured Allofournierella sp. TaxID=1940258 RepID=UPI0025D94861|nr:hypothetical protein [uncultured Fournierella sp.]